MKNNLRKVTLLGITLFLIVTMVSTFLYSWDNTFSVVFNLLVNAFITMAILLFSYMYSDYDKSGKNLRTWLKEPL
jgi:putative effector of murein hydrolase